ncbi:hypothetical protein ACJX0J_018363, partial [Zea mays]
FYIDVVEMLFHKQGFALGLVVVLKSIRAIKGLFGFGAIVSVDVELGGKKRYLTEPAEGTSLEPFFGGRFWDQFFHNYFVFSRDFHNYFSVVYCYDIFGGLISINIEFMLLFSVFIDILKT